MASKVMRREVLGAFKKLHQTRKKVFSEDNYALSAAREKINTEFRKNKELSSEADVKELIQLANAVENEMRTSIIQAKEVAPGRYEARITEETVMQDNVEFDILKCPDKPIKRTSPCGQNK